MNQGDKVFETKLKYKRRTFRTIQGVKYLLNNPSNERSKSMRRVKGCNTSLELKLGRALSQYALRFRKGSTVYGKPDFALKKWKVAVFCDGNFWHGYTHPNFASMNNGEFWKAKIKKNIKRDKEVNKKLFGDGWKVLRFSEKEIKQNIFKCVSIVKSELIKRQRSINGKT